MKTIKREMKSELNEIEQKGCSQASFNSDGVLTLRNYNVCDKDNDIIIVFSDEETRAIIRLFNKLQNNGFELPY